MRFFASISYNGSGFSGWQIQQNAPSIQDEVQKALSAVLREKTDVTGAGRTDTGVNASGFTAHFDFDGDIILKEHDRIIYKINAILPGGIVVNSLQILHPQQQGPFRQRVLVVLQIPSGRGRDEQGRRHDSGTQGLQLL